MKVKGGPPQEKVKTARMSLCVNMLFFFLSPHGDGQVEKRAGGLVCLVMMSPLGRQSWWFFFDEDREQDEKRRRGGERGGGALVWDSLVGT